MEPLRIIDILFSVIVALLGAGWMALFHVLRKNSEGVASTAALVMSEKEKTAALVMSEKEKLAALVMAEKEKLAAQVKAEHDKLEDKFIDFRIKVAQDYATTTLLEKVQKPMLEKLTDIEKLLHTKLDRREFELHKETARVAK